MSLGDRIREARLGAGLKKADLAGLLKTSKASVTQWERGAVQNIKLEFLFGMQDVTGYSARWIALEEGPKKVPKYQLTPDEMALVEQYRESIKKAVTAQAEKPQRERERERERESKSRA